MIVNWLGKQGDAGNQAYGVKSFGRREGKSSSSLQEMSSRTVRVTRMKRDCPGPDPPSSVKVLGEGGLVKQRRLCHVGDARGDGMLLYFFFKSSTYLITISLFLFVARVCIGYG